MTVALAALAVFLGATLQSATGFGFALVAAPFLFALLGPREAVTAGVLLGLLLNGLTLATERRRPVVLGRDAWRARGVVGAGARARGARAARAARAPAVGARRRSRCWRVWRCALRGGAPRRAARPRAWHAPAAGATSGALATVDLAQRPAAGLLPARARRLAGGDARHAGGGLHRPVGARRCRRWC